MKPLERRVSLRNSGLVDPHRIDDYFSRAGYSGLRRALDCGIEQAIELLRAAGLGGEAAAWERCTRAEAEQKYVVCNALDPDPLAQSARYLLGTDPHSVLEGLLIAAYAAGASQCFVCVNADYHEEIGNLQIALEQMSELGLLGGSIMDCDFRCGVTIEKLSGSLVAGQNTALLHALEGRDPVPSLGGNDLEVRGLHGRPTLMFTPETLSRISAILQGHPAMGDGVETKVLTLSGCGVGGCTVEIPLGTTIAQLLEQVEDFHPAVDIAAVQFGGPTGPILAGAALGMPITAEFIGDLGYIAQSGGVRLIPEGVCGVALARDTVGYLRGESCGKCAFCREGVRQLWDALIRVAEFDAEEADFDLLIELGQEMRKSSICDLGKTAALPVLTSLDVFADDYRSHLRDKRCMAG